MFPLRDKFVSFEPTATYIAVRTTFSSLMTHDNLLILVTHVTVRSDLLITCHMSQFAATGLGSDCVDAQQPRLGPPRPLHQRRNDLPLHHAQHEGAGAGPRTPRAAPALLQHPRCLALHNSSPFSSSCRGLV